MFLRKCEEYDGCTNVNMIVNFEEWQVCSVGVCRVGGRFYTWLINIRRLGLVNENKDSSAVSWMVYHSCQLMRFSRVWRTSKTTHHQKPWMWRPTSTRRRSVTHSVWLTHWMMVTPISNFDILHHSIYPMNGMSMTPL